MKKINVLDKYVAELIAAGEVVERPLSVVKELLENSIDAGATRISIEIKNGGNKFIKISDNGSGIFREDIRNAFLRHATSKVKNEEDLESISTLGFRGEALASICAVSKVEVITCAEGEEIGTRYVINGGNEEILEDIGRAKGTTFIIRDLFFNTPARMKFLKKDIVEANSIAGIIDRIAVSHPEIAIKFVRDGKETLNTLGDGKLSSCIYTVYGKEFFSGMIPVDYKLNGVAVHGFVSKPLSARPNRSMQHFFINGRYVKTKTGNVALEEAFKNSIMVGKHPYCVLYIDVAYESVDVNVHPSKIEVRFINEKPIFDAIYYAVKTSLMNFDDRKKLEFNRENTIHEKSVSEKRSEENLKSKIKISSSPKQSIYKLGERGPASSISFSDVSSQKKTKENADINLEKINNFYEFKPNLENEIKPLKKETFQRLNFNVIDISASEDFKEVKDQKKVEELKLESKETQNLSNSQDLKLGASEEVINKSQEIEVYSESINKPQEIKFDNEFSEPSLKVVGEAFDCYVIIQSWESELLIVDKHAAHERILYEKLKKEETIKDSQVLLEPIAVVLDKDEYAAILDNLNLLADSGYDVEDFGMGSIVVRSIPVYVEISQVKDSIIEIADYILKNKKSLSTSYMDWLYHNMACRAAIKAGKSSSNAELLDLVMSLSKNPDIKYCPHGRPVSIVMEKRDIEKQFGRT